MCGTEEYYFPLYFTQTNVYAKKIQLIFISLYASILKNSRQFDTYLSVVEIQQTFMF